jgi:hypothetical protein
MSTECSTRLQAKHVQRAWFVTHRSSMTNPFVAPAADVHARAPFANCVRGGWTAVCMLVLSLHVAATTVYVMPDNPLRLRLAPLVSRYIHPYFDQAWKLFAPDPAVPIHHLAVSCRIDAGGATPVETPPIEVTSALYSRQQRERIGPAQRLLRTQTAALGLLGGPREELVAKVLRLRAAGVPQVTDFTARLEQALRTRHRHTLDVLVRITSAECDRLHPGAKVRDVRPIWMLVEPLPFSRRDRPLSEAPVSTYDLGWFSHERVAPYWQRAKG